MEYDLDLDLVCNQSESRSNFLELTYCIINKEKT